jgi:RNA polymerase sigma-70 factor (ECF subfamily)
MTMNDNRTSSIPDPTNWVDVHGDVLYRFALIRVKDTHLAEDLVQDTFIAALEGLGSFKGGSSVRTWLVGILKHKVLDYFRKSAREAPSTDLSALEAASEEQTFNRWGQWRQGPGKWPEDPGNLLENKEFWRAFTRCLDGLPDALRRAFSLREIDGMKTDEICKILNITSTNLWVMLHRARGRLRDCLDNTWFKNDTTRNSGGDAGTS